MRLLIAALGLLALAGCWTPGHTIGPPDKMSRNDRTTYEREYCQKKGNSDDVLECRRNSQDIPPPNGASVSSGRKGKDGPTKIPAA